jgi:predicted O-methyltransferase YrrM
VYSKFKLAQKYFQYYVTASNGKGHGIHSPFVFDFINNVLNDSGKYACYDLVENLRYELLHDRSMMEVMDFGAGSATGHSKKRSVASIAKHSAKSRKMGQLLFRISRFSQPNTVLELGTSLGLSTAYLASGNPNAKVITLEGATTIASKASRNLASLQLANIELVTGNFDHSLPAILSSLQSPAHPRRIDLAFIDGNHRKEPSFRYFDLLVPSMADASLIIFDDIHWSLEMEETWTAIKEDSRVMLSIDLFFFGLVFFRNEFKVPQHFTIRF